MIKWSRSFSNVSSVAGATQFRKAMSLIPSAVCILTTAADAENRAGMTISSLTSLSLKPHQLLSFNIATPSKTLDLLHSIPQSHMLIHLFESSPHTAKLCREFSDNPHAAVHSLPLMQIFPQISLPTFPEACITFHCTKHSSFLVQDHELWVAKVQSIKRAPDHDSPLLYSNHKFHELGTSLKES
ncbi:hypothetical protein CANCADRAFT_144766 [Tortispora caseinolytica NRRL Y-17796]|uniref:Flavin reductase like domain-containing protein n=1 Tax=Tortispora caseinolytica NRRL Y-17796 TaxID=767744 RepID=A0A1E4T9D8_9ASCO|nr:hypothetical protein CANCADRAFT_144766 [Tortispora caseinolytica NRRL Y-17796]